MSEHVGLPARYDHVGSFLRPLSLLKARAARAAGSITAEQLRGGSKDEAIAEVVKFQEDVGLKSITDSTVVRTSTSISWTNSVA